MSKAKFLKTAWPCIIDMISVTFPRNLAPIQDMEILIIISNVSYYWVGMLLWRGSLNNVNVII